MRQQGTVVTLYNNDGWITPAAGGGLVYVHVNEITGPTSDGAAPPPGFRTLEVGNFVEFDTVLGSRGLYATRVKVLEETPIGDLNLSTPLP